MPNSNNLFDLDILNELGASIYSVKDHQGSSISLSFLNSGMYFIRLSSNNQTIVKKIIKN
ncbi:T9SS type A sorting domain-containing protein [Vitellibacter sp. q18]|nr:T9SS type A sorting domain-containing protein [Aequorivita lutea]